MTPPPTPDEIRDKAMERFNKLAPDKYDRGQEEHGGNLSETVKLGFLEEEIVDLWFYISALRMKLEKQHENTGSHCGNPDCGCD